MLLDIEHQIEGADEFIQFQQRISEETFIATLRDVKKKIKQDKAEEEGKRKNEEEKKHQDNKRNKGIERHVPKDVRQPRAVSLKKVVKRQKEKKIEYT